LRWTDTVTKEGSVEEEDEETLGGGVVGPKLVPTTPIMRYAMRQVVSEYLDDRTESEYASIVEGSVDEY
jgi:hypothetical protein